MMNLFLLSKKAGKPTLIISVWTDKVTRYARPPKRLADGQRKSTNTGAF